MQEKVLRAEVSYYLKGFHKAFLDNNFLFLQAADAVTMHHGFRSQHMFVRHFLMTEALL
jgi:hypothetical protein